MKFPLSLIMLSFLGVGCGEELRATVTTAAAPPGTALWLEAAAQDDGSVLVTLRAREFGEVMGYAAHLRFDPAVVGLAASGGFSLAPTLGPDLVDEAIYGSGMRTGDLYFGATRRGSAAGPRVLDGPFTVGNIRFVPKHEGRCDLVPSRVVVRRADGTYVPVATSGATIEVGGAS